jgi:RNase H-fold protein (predicted Holliday junction resolvase)
METNVKDNGQAKVANTVSADKKPQFVAGNPVNVVSKAEPKKDEPKKDAEKPQVQATQQSEQPKVEVAKPEVKAGPVKDEPKKIVLNLEGTLKFIEEMHRKAKQRTKLQETIKNLDDFEVELRDEAETTDANYYNGCVLTIEDDNRRKFETKNPTIIWTVAQLVNNMCVDKLAEIEAGIVIPQ